MRQGRPGLALQVRDPTLVRRLAGYPALSQDLQLAEESGYCEENMFKLWDRRGQCLARLKR